MISIIPCASRRDADSQVRNDADNQNWDKVICKRFQYIHLNSPISMIIITMIPTIKAVTDTTSMSHPLFQLFLFPYADRIV